MNMENNKIFGAILVAGIAALVSGFISQGAYHTEELDKPAYHIDVATKAGPAAIAAPTGPEPVTELLAEADLARGKKLSKACMACHSFNDGGKHKTGPNLWNIVGRDRGKVDGFSYSTAMKEIGGTWGYDELNEFLWKPKKAVPGTKMNYRGLKKTKDRANLIAWLRSLSVEPQPLP